MNADIPPAREPARSTAPAQGGTVEPANRAEIAKARFQTPEEPVAERFELRDPMAELTYHATSRAEIIAKAEQIGSTRFTAIDAEGRRTPMHQVGATWQRGATLPPRAATPVQDIDDRTPSENIPAKFDNVVPLTSASPASPTLSAGAQRAAAKVDAEAERAANVSRLEAALIERYVIKRAPVTIGDVTIGRTEYRFRGDTTRVAFTESTFKLVTDTNSPSVARSMVDLAQARDWRSLRVSGNEDFKRMVWLEAGVRGVKTLGYEPSPTDLELVKREREARAVNRIEPARDERNAEVPGVNEKASGRGGGRKAVLAAIEAVLVAKGVPEARREAVMAAAADKLAQRLRDGQSVKVKVYDTSAPSQRPAVVPAPEVQRSRDRGAPVR